MPCARQGKPERQATKDRDSIIKPRTQIPFFESNFKATGILLLALCSAHSLVCHSEIFHPSETISQFSSRLAVIYTEKQPGICPENIHHRGSKIPNFSVTWFWIVVEVQIFAQAFSVWAYSSILTSRGAFSHAVSIGWFLQDDHIGTLMDPLLSRYLLRQLQHEWFAHQVQWKSDFFTFESVVSATWEPPIIISRIIKRPNESEFVALLMTGNHEGAVGSVVWL